MTSQHEHWQATRQQPTTRGISNLQIQARTRISTEQHRLTHWKRRRNSATSSLRRILDFRRIMPGKRRSCRAQIMTAKIQCQEETRYRNWRENSGEASPQPERVDIDNPTNDLPMHSLFPAKSCRVSRRSSLSWRKSRQPRRCLRWTSGSRSWSVNELAERSVIPCQVLTHAHMILPGDARRERGPLCHTASSIPLSCHAFSVSCPVL